MPKELTIEITNACTLNCEMCSSEAASLEDAVHMPAGNILRYVRKYADFSLVRLSGGEPTQHPDFQQIAKIIKAENRQVIVLTSGNYNNGPLPVKMPQSCKPYIDEAVFAIHGSWDLHDCIATSVRNPNDISDQQPIMNMLESVNRARSLQYDYSFHTCVLKKNISHLENIVKIVDGFCRADYQKTRMRFLKPVYQGRARSLEQLSKEEWSRARVLARELGQKYNMEITYTGQDGCRCKNEKAAIIWNGKEIGCSALKSRYYGGKRPCQQPTQVKL